MNTEQSPRIPELPKFHKEGAEDTEEALPLCLRDLRVLFVPYVLDFPMSLMRNSA
jgi:hypothetical protein